MSWWSKLFGGPAGHESSPVKGSAESRVVTRGHREDTTDKEIDDLVRSFCQGPRPLYYDEEHEKRVKELRRELVSKGDRAVPILADVIRFDFQGEPRSAMLAVVVLEDIGTNRAVEVLSGVLHWPDTRTAEMLRLYERAAEALVSIDSEAAWVAIRAAASGPAKDYVNAIAQHARARLKPNADGTSSDERSSRIWQEDDDGRMRSLDEARSYCSSLALGGKHDWRLPTAKELRTLTGTPNLREGAYWAEELSGDPFHRHSFRDFAGGWSGGRPDDDIARVRAVREDNPSCQRNLQHPITSPPRAPSTRQPPPAADPLTVYKRPIAYCDGCECVLRPPEGLIALGHDTSRCFLYCEECFEGVKHLLVRVDKPFLRSLAKEWWTNGFVRYDRWSSR
jgi:hypothetical protein